MLHWPSVSNNVTNDAKYPLNTIFSYITLKIRKNAKNVKQCDENKKRKKHSDAKMDIQLFLNIYNINDR